MTDPAALDPVLPEAERSTADFNDPGLSHDRRYDAFVDHVHAGGKVEPRDWMPDEYRTAVLRFVEMHANSELMGVLPEREWIMRAPTLARRKNGVEGDRIRHRWSSVRERTARAP